MLATVSVPLLTKDDVNGFRWKAIALKALAAREPSASDPQVAEAIQLLIEFYDDAELAIFNEKTPVCLTNPKEYDSMTEVVKNHHRRMLKWAEMIRDDQNEVLLGRQTIDYLRTFVQLVSQATVKKYKKKLARLESFIQSEERAQQPEVSQRVALFRNFYADVEKKATLRRTRNALADFKAEEETMAQHENDLIRYVIIMGENKARLESSKNL